VIQSYHTYDWVISGIACPHVRHVHHTHDSIMSHIRFSHVTHACYECGMHNSSINGSICRHDRHVHHTYDSVMSHIRFSHVTRVWYECGMHHSFILSTGTAILLIRRSQATGPKADRRQMAATVLVIVTNEKCHMWMIWIVLSHVDDINRLILIVGLTI